MGVTHRGRLNILANVVGNSTERLFAAFEGTVHPDFPADEGDVKYHQGARTTRKTESGRDVRITVPSNPSHLEAVDPVVEGRSRAKQDLTALARAEATGRVLPVILHGDAAFAGQGIVAEVFNLSQLHGYRTGGTIHIVINNQIGFTTDPAAGRSSLYSTDVAKIVQVPIFHVNARRPRGGLPRPADRPGLPPGMAQGRGHRPDRLPPPRPQRGRRADLHPAPDVPPDPGAPRRPGAVRQAPRQGRRPDRLGRPAARGSPARLLRRIAGRRESQGRARRPTHRRPPRRLRNGRGGRNRRSPRHPRQDRPSPDHRPLGFQPQSQDGPAARAPRQDDRRLDSHRLGHGRSVGLRFSPAGRHSHPHVRPGQRPRHLLPAPPGPERHPDRREVDPSLHPRRTAAPAHRDVRRGGACPSRPRRLPATPVTFQIYDSPVIGSRRPRLRIRLLRRIPKVARALGSPIRRLRQRRPGHHRPVRQLRRRQVAGMLPPDDAPPARLRRPGPRAQQRPDRALPPALRRREPVGLQRDDSRAVLPPPPPPDAQPSRTDR